MAERQPNVLRATQERQENSMLEAAEACSREAVLRCTLPSDWGSYYHMHTTFALPVFKLILARC